MKWHLVRQQVLCPYRAFNRSLAARWPPAPQGLEIGLALAIATVGDDNGDCLKNVAVAGLYAFGTRLEDVGTYAEAERGLMAIVLGSVSGWFSQALSLDAITSYRGVLIEGAAVHARSGLVVTGVRYVNGGGIDDLSLGAPTETTWITYTYQSE